MDPKPKFKGGEYMRCFLSRDSSYNTPSYQEAVPDGTIVLTEKPYLHYGTDMYTYRILGTHVLSADEVCLEYCEDQEAAQLIYDLQREHDEL